MRPPIQEGSLSPNVHGRSPRAVVATAMFALAIAAIVRGGEGASAQEQPTWPQFQGGPGHAGVLPDGPEPPYRVRWTLPAPAGDALSPPIVIGQQVVAVGAEAVYGIDATSGIVSWEVPRAGGPLSSPAFASGARGGILVYLDGPSEGDEPASPTPSPTGGASPSPGAASPSPSGDAEQGSALVGVAFEDRSERWRTSLQGLSRSGVTVEGGSAFVGDQEGNVYAVSLRDGTITWTAEIGGRVDTPPSVADGNVYVVARDSDGGRVVIGAFDAASGERAWPPASVQANSTAGSAVAAGNGSVFLGSADRFVRAVSASDGAERWASLVLSLFSPATAPAFDGNSVIAADVSGGLYRLDASDGERIWTYQLNEVVFRSSPVVSGSAALLGLSDGRLVAVDVESGHLVWDGGPSAGLVGTIALASDAVVAVKGGPDAGLIAFESDPAGALVDVPSPTELDPGTTLSRYAIAAVVVFALAFVPGLLARRRGMAGSEDTSQGEVEPTDDDGASPTVGKDDAD